MNTNGKEKLLEQVQNDLKNISLESKRSKSMQGLREATEEAIVKVRGAAPNANLYQLTNQILYPLVQGCESKDGKVVKLSLGLMQRLIVHKTIDFKGAKYITDTLWMLMEANIEHMKVLQTITLLVTSTHVAQHETLAKCLVISFRLNFTKDPTVNKIAGATVRQLVPAIFERASNKETSEEEGFVGEQPSPAFAQLVSQMLPKDTDPFVVDAFLMFQDIVLLVGAEQPVWMTGIMEMTRSFGLELLESLLFKFPEVFSSHNAFKMLLKERVCSLVIKLFSPNTKYKTSIGGANAQDRPHFPITSKLLRVVSILIVEYHEILTTESEIFLSLILKFLDPDKPSWQNSMALEVLHKIIVKPQLLHFVCSTFDCNDHSTKVFQDIVNGLGAYVQNVMLAAQTDLDQQQQQQQQQGGINVAVYGGGAGVSQVPGFFYRNVWKPLTITFIGGQTKELFLDLADRNEIPSVSDGYGISLAYACILDIVRSMTLLMNVPLDRRDDTVLKQLVESSWCGILAPLSLLLDASTDDSTAESILKAMESYASICGDLRLTKPRDAYLASLCKASLPPHYTLNVLKATPCTQTVSGPPKSQKESHYDNGSQMGDNDIRHQVVAVGTPLPTASLPTSAHQGPVMLTAKNLQCMRAILSVAHCHGDMLENSWHIILTTLQHLVWILGLKPVAGGGLTTTSVTSSSDNNSVITTAVMADLPVLSNMVSRLFESSGSLSESSVGHLIEALCKLSDESMELATSNREPSLFAVAKLLETALVNLSRIEVVWRSITSHLLVVSQHPHLRMRQWGSEAITFLIRQALQHPFEPPIKENNRIQLLILSPLTELCGIPYPDVRQKQLDTVLHILNNSGDALDQGWPLILTIVGSIERSHSDILIRSAFQCLQLVFTDFLPTIPYRCYPQCVESATKFGSQETELNVSLTAVGLLWNLSDYFFQNVKTLRGGSQQEGGGGGNDTSSQIFPEFPGCENISAFDKLWMCLYYRLKDLCLDSRPAVRKSSGQTLFSTIAAHGSVLESNTWQAVLWQVLFPLLDNVIIQSDNASSEKVAQSQVIMIHHSRNTAQKQWAETKVLTISGVVRVFNTKRKLLKTMKDYSKAWILLLEYVEKMALSDTSEVSLAALKSLHEMIQSAGDEQNLQQSANDDGSLNDINWSLCWKAWLNIGMQKSKYIANTSDIVSHGILLLTGFVQIFMNLFVHIEKQFKQSDAEKLGEVLLACVQVPINSEMEARDVLTPLHAAAMDAVKETERVALSNQILITEIFEIYFKFATIAFSPKGEQIGRHRERLSLLGEVALEQAANFFERVVDVRGPDVPVHSILKRAVEVLQTPLRMKYQCFRDSNWRVAINVLIKFLKKGVPVARAEKAELYSAFWSELSITLERFLFPDSINEQKQEEKMADEAVDCHIIELLRDEILPHPKAVPADFIRSIVILLNRGSIHSTIQLNEDCSGTVGLREDFAKQCFETLLDFSLLRSDLAFDTGQEDESSLTNKLAITSLLQRFKEVLVDAIEGEKLNRNIPLQRQKTAEIAFVLRAIATVISSMKKTAQPKVDQKTWMQVIALYPYLVQCTDTNSVQVSASVKDALLEFHDLLKPMT